jgi:integrase/recombinase XerD
MKRLARCLRARMWCRSNGLLYSHIRRPVTPHVLRHTFAVTAVQKGISLPALQRLLGHDRLTTTEIYLNLSPEDVIREFHQKW